MEQRSGYKFCTGCGAAAAAGMSAPPTATAATHTAAMGAEAAPPSCPSCGKEQRPGYKFCTGCGADRDTGPQMGALDTADDLPDDLPDDLLDVMMADDGDDLMEMAEHAMEGAPPAGAGTQSPEAHGKTHRAGPYFGPTLPP